jgi:hypothetical protein
VAGIKGDVYVGRGQTNLLGARDATGVSAEFSSWRKPSFSANTLSADLRTPQTAVAPEIADIVGGHGRMVCGHSENGCFWDKATIHEIDAKQRRRHSQPI